jgi:hypothetical protein
MHLGLKPAAGAVEKPKVPVPAKTVWIGGTSRRDSLDYRFQIHSRGMVSSPPPRSGPRAQHFKTKRFTSL